MLVSTKAVLRVDVWDGLRAGSKVCLPVEHLGRSLAGSWDHTKGDRMASQTAVEMVAQKADTKVVLKAVAMVDLSGDKLVDRWADYLDATGAVLWAERWADARVAHLAARRAVDWAAGRAAKWAERWADSSVVCSAVSWAERSVVSRACWWDRCTELGRVPCCCWHPKRPSFHQHLRRFLRGN